MSNPEDSLAMQLDAVGMKFEREYRFHPDRRWRSDFAFEKAKVLVEVEGGHWVAGRHNRGTGFERDMEKYNTATELGWSVLRYTPRMVRTGEALRQIERVVCR